jgi:hypothetical protein
MASETIKAKITRKAKNGKGFMLEGYENWFNATDKTEPFLAKIEVGKVVEISYFKKGVKSEVTLIKEVSGGATETKTESPQEDTNGTYTNCSVCGKELKGKGVNYPKCWDCKDKAPKEKAYINRREKEESEPKKEWTSKSNYGSAEDVAGKEVGCAANCAASILAGRQEDPDTLLEIFRILFNGILEHIRANK